MVKKYVRIMYLRKIWVRGKLLEKYDGKIPDEEVTVVLLLALDREKH